MTKPVETIARRVRPTTPCQIQDVVPDSFAYSEHQRITEEKAHMPRINRGCAHITCKLHDEQRSSGLIMSRGRYLFCRAGILRV